MKSVSVELILGGVMSVKIDILNIVILGTKVWLRIKTASCCFKEPYYMRQNIQDFWDLLENQ